MPWPAGLFLEGAAPVAAEGTAVAAFARDLDHPRWLYVLPNGDVLVAETRTAFATRQRRDCVRVGTPGV